MFYWLANSTEHEDCSPVLISVLIKHNVIYIYISRERERERERVRERKRVQERERDNIKLI